MPGASSSLLAHYSGRTSSCSLVVLLSPAGSCSYSPVPGLQGKATAYSSGLRPQPSGPPSSVAIPAHPQIFGWLKMFRLIGKILGKTPSPASAPRPAPRPDFVSSSVCDLQSVRGFSSGVGGHAEKRNLLDHKRRLLAAKYELRRKLYKALCRDPDLPSNLLDKHRYKLAKLPRNSSFTRLRNRCIFTGRPRAVYETFRMSRIVFRELASQGQLMGIKKASW